jgi:hypothetical protein
MRRDDWLDRLWKTIEAAQHRPFFFGACTQLAAECIDAMTGSEWAPDIQGLYARERRARALIRRAGGLAPLVCERLGPSSPPLTARPGDIVLLEFSSGPAVGISVGARIACAGDPGVVYLPPHTTLAVWRID